jgi:hypothetical protein
MLHEGLLYLHTQNQYEAFKWSEQLFNVLPFSAFRNPTSARPDFCVQVYPTSSSFLSYETGPISYRHIFTTISIVHMFIIISLPNSDSARHIIHPVRPIKVIPGKVVFSLNFLGQSSFYFTGQVRTLTLSASSHVRFYKLMVAGTGEEDLSQRGLTYILGFWKVDGTEDG